MNIAINEKIILRKFLEKFYTKIYICTIITEILILDYIRIINFVRRLNKNVLFFSILRLVSNLIK